ncbi:MAG: folylpolyglutamate synthase/dihydrofolate synthase family protein [Verrucomicrobiota bacterium]
MNYREALAWLYGTQRFGIKLGLENIQRLLAALDLPARDQQFIHVAGTNGKGSVCAMIDAICRAADYRTGLFTSPHLITFRERIRVNGEMISEDGVAEGLSFICNFVADWKTHPTFFEITTALALHYFRQQRTEIVVLETGVGGRMDATNAVQPIVSVITPIALDHQKWLGDTLAEIAGEKAGIIKRGVPAVSARQLADAEKVLRARATELGSSIQFVDQVYDGELSLKGTHQKQNAALAIAAFRAAKFDINESAIASGLQSVRWPARFQSWGEHTIIDGAHNPTGAKILTETWRDVFGDKRATLVLAVLNDKDVAGICRALAPIAQRALLPQIRSERALSPRLLEKTFQEVAPEIPMSILPSTGVALDEARKHSDKILIAGSLHFAGEALATLQGVPTAFEECAQ